MIKFKIQIKIKKRMLKKWIRSIYTKTKKSLGRISMQENDYLIINSFYSIAFSKYNILL
jgi:hypothetical protein